MQFEHKYFHIGKLQKSLIEELNTSMKHSILHFNSNWMVKKIMKIKQYDLHHCMNTVVSAARIFIVYSRGYMQCQFNKTWPRSISMLQ